MIIDENKKCKRSDKHNKDKRHNNKQTHPEKQQQKRTVTILGDSIIKGIKFHKIKKQFVIGETIYISIYIYIFVKSFPGAKSS